MIDWTSTMMPMASNVGMGFLLNSCESVQQPANRIGDAGAAALAHCSGPDRYFSMLDVLFETQNNWARAADPIAALKRLGKLGGLTEKKPRTAAREVWLLQRKTSTIGRGLGKTSGWAHRTVLKDSGVHLVPGVTYDRVDDDGLHIRVGATDDTPGEAQVLDVDHVVVCAGQESERALYDELVAAGVAAHLVGGADVAAELDAKRAIKQGTEVVAAL